MHRIDGPNAAPGGLFTDGDPVAGTPATIVTDDWANAVQEELVSVVLGAGLALNKPDNGQVLAAIRALIDVAVPVGQVMFGYFTAAPSGFLLLNGAVVSRASYPRLFAHANARGLVVSEAAWAASGWGWFGAGDGATTFRLPDVRAEFPRFADAGRGVDAGRAVGGWAPDMLASHTHDMGFEAGGAVERTTPVGSAFADETITGNPTTATGGHETRPRSVAFMGCVRY